MKYYGASPVRGPAVFTPSSHKVRRVTGAELALQTRERAKAPTFGERCAPVFLPGTWEAVTDINALASSDPCSGLSRLKAVTVPLRMIQDANTRAIQEVLDDRYSYGWLIGLFRDRYSSVVSRADRAKAACATANAALDSAIGALEDLVERVEAAQGSTIPFLRTAALRWCDNATTYVPMERDICSDVGRTRREMMRGRKPGVYRSWKKSCDTWKERRTSTGAVTATYPWPRRMDEDACSDEVGWSITDGCPQADLPWGGTHSRAIYEQGCFISESCYDKYGFKSRAQLVRNTANNAVRMFNDSDSYFYNVISAIVDAVDACEYASDTLGEALNKLYKTVSNGAVKSGIITLAGVVTVGTGIPVITAAYNRMQKAIKDSRNDVRALPPTFRAAKEEYHDLKELGWDTSGGCAGGWEEAAEDQARRIRSNMDAMLGAMGDLTPTCGLCIPLPDSRRMGGVGSRVNLSCRYGWAGGVATEAEAGAGETQGWRRCRWNPWRTSRRRSQN